MTTSGNEVLEWNGVLLRNKTYEEVERVINATSGEIEIIIDSAPRSRQSRQQTAETIYDTTTGSLQ